jgi:hypothetical protein
MRLIALFCLVGCTTAVQIEDGEHEVFGPSVDGSDEARAVLAVVNRATASELDDDVGLTRRVAAGIVAGRPFATLTTLDAVPHVGPRTLERLLAYATERGLVLRRRVISRSDASAYESESWLAASGDHLAAVWTAPRTSGEWPGGVGPAFGTIAYAFSSDAGVSWTKPNTVAFPGLETPVNVKVAADAGGTFWAAWLGRNINSDLSDAIVVARADRGAETFAAAVAATAPGPSGPDRVWYDLPAITAHRGSIVTAYAYEDRSNPEESCMGTQVARSDEGTTWTRTNVGTCAPIHNNHALCASESSDTIWLAYTVGGADGVRIDLASSTDGGRTWPRPRTISTSGERVGIDPITCAADATGVWVVYGTSHDAIESGIFPKASGIHVVNIGNKNSVRRFGALDPAVGFAMHPQIVVDDAGVTVLYHAGTRDDDPAGTLRYTRMPPGATKFGPSVAIDGPLRFDQNWGVPPFVGDYFGAASAAGRLVTAYAIEEAGDIHIAFRRVDRD